MKIGCNQLVKKIIYYQNAAGYIRDKGFHFLVDEATFIRGFQSQHLFKDCLRTGAYLGYFWFTYIFPLKQWLRPLGYLAPITLNFYRCDCWPS